MSKSPHNTEPSQSPGRARRMTGRIISLAPQSSITHHAAAEPPFRPAFDLLEKSELGLSSTEVATIGVALLKLVQQQQEAQSQWALQSRVEGMRIR